MWLLVLQRTMMDSRDASLEVAELLVGFVIVGSCSDAVVGLAVVY